jgi:arylsulfatase A-like enzyme
MNKSEDSPKINRPGWGAYNTIQSYIEGKESYKKTNYYKHAVQPGIEGLKNLSNQQKPWCLFISTDMAGHTSAPREYYNLYDKGKITLPESYKDDMKDKPAIYQRLRRQIWDQLSEDEVKSSMINYWANCTLQDKFFGLILDELEATGQKDNTIVIFLSDHGEYNFAHGLQYMGIPSFREAYNVPVMVRWPEGIKNPGRTVNEFISQADFAPTFLEIAGVKAKDRKTGQSLVPFFEGGVPENWPDAFYSQTKGNEVYYTQRIVMTHEYKYVYNAFDFDEMYDLKKDPYEMNNLIHPDKFKDDYNAGERKKLSRENPWPHLPQELNKIRKQMLTKMWKFAEKEEDVIFSAFPPVAVSPFGPAVDKEK